MAGLRPSLLLLALLAAVPGVAARAQEPAAETPEALVGQGYDLLAQGKAISAVRAFIKADELAGGKSLDALVGWARAALAAGSHRNAEQPARRAVDLAEDPINSAAAHNLLGIALLGDGTANPERLAEAERAFRKVIELTAGQALAPRFSLAKTLGLQGQKPEALALVREVLAAGPTGDLLKESRVLNCSLREAGGEETSEPLVSPLNTSEAAPTEPAATPLLAPAPRRVEGQISPPEKLFAPLPRYTDSDRRSRAQGVVIVEAIIDEHGCVTGTRVLAGVTPGLDREAVRAIRRWVFEPAKVGGVPVTVYRTLTVNFQLQ